MSSRPSPSGSSRLALLICTFGYIGYFPIAPGTIGSLGGLIVYGLLHAAGANRYEIVVIAALFAAGVWSGTIAERHFGGIDPGPVVIDEVVGMLITLAFIPPSGVAVVAGFFVFRLFDIIKPYPAGRLERWHGGLGVMADDAMAAIYANLVVRAVVYAAS